MDIESDPEGEVLTFTEEDPLPEIVEEPSEPEQPEASPFRRMDIE